MAVLTPLWGESFIKGTLFQLLLARKGLYGKWVDRPSQPDVGWCSTVPASMFDSIGLLMM